MLRDELDFFVEVNPEAHASTVAFEFGRFLENYQAELRDMYPRPEVPDVEDLRELIPVPAQYHQLACEIEATGLAEIDYDYEGTWLRIHPELSSVLLAALADSIAQANDMAVVTDEPDAHGTLNGWPVETLAHALLRGNAEPPRLDAEEVASLYAVTAIKAVVPDNLGDVPVERIVRVRRKLADEFDAFRDLLASLTDRFAELARIEDANVLQARLELMVERDLRRPTDKLERNLRTLGLEPGRAVLSLKSLELPAAAAAAASGLGLPAAAGEAGLVAARLIASGVKAGSTAREMRRGATGYLLGLRRQLTPNGVAERVRRTLGRVTSRIGGGASDTRR